MIKDDNVVGSNLISYDSYFAKGIEFNGTPLELNEGSNAIGISSAPVVSKVRL